VPELTPELAPQIVEAIAQNAEEAAGALGRALDGEFVLKAGEATTLGERRPDGGGLVAAFTFGDEVMLALLPAASGLVPDWTKDPDPTGASKLSTLAQELSMLLVPESLMADDFAAAWVDDFGAAIERAGADDAAAALPIEVARGETLGELLLVWPAASAKAAITSPAAEEAAEAPADAPAATGGAPPGGESTAGEGEPPRSRVLRWNAPPARDFRDLPPHAVSALQVRVPLSVNLAGKKLSVKDVIELAPGSIITFEKGCDDPLEVTVGSRPVAKGEAVKVGERFGVRVQEMILPEEHFRPLLPPERD